MTAFELPMTIHASERFQERGFTKDILGFLFNYGLTDHVGDNTTKFYVTKKELKKLLDLKTVAKDVKSYIRSNFDKLTKKYILIVEGNVRTCINQYR